MKNVKSIKIKNWEVCCNEILEAVVNDSIELNYNEDNLKLRGVAKEIEYCPFCGNKLPERLDAIEGT